MDYHGQNGQEEMDLSVAQLNIASTETGLEMWWHQTTPKSILL